MRPITKLFCPSNHRIGTVGADEDGLLVEYTAEVWHPNGVFGAPATDPLPDDVAGFIGAYCPKCRALVELDVRELRAAALAAQRGVHAESLNADEKAWIDAGHAPTIPPGTPRLKTDPR